jgi:hypothetical protein
MEGGGVPTRLGRDAGLRLPASRRVLSEHTPRRLVAAAASGSCCRRYPGVLVRAPSVSRAFARAPPYFVVAEQRISCWHQQQQ